MVVVCYACHDVLLRLLLKPLNRPHILQTVSLLYLYCFLCDSLSSVVLIDLSLLDPSIIFFLLLSKLSYPLFSQSLLPHGSHLLSYLLCTHMLVMLSIPDLSSCLALVVVSHIKWVDLQPSKLLTVDLQVMQFQELIHIIDQVSFWYALQSLYLVLKLLSLNVKWFLQLSFLLSVQGICGNLILKSQTVLSTVGVLRLIGVKFILGCWVFWRFHRGLLILLYGDGIYLS